MIDELNSLHNKILHSKFAEEVTEQEIQALVMAKELLEQPKADWIPCEVELPKENTEVWVTVEELDGSCYTQASWLQDGQWVIKKTPLEPKVIAWMPKPQLYKKEGAE